jgi:hypothetical protein
MRILAFTQENYPSNYAASFVLMHQAMALEELGHEVHFYNTGKHPLGLRDYLHCFDFDAIFLDLEFLRSQPLLRTLAQYRRAEPVRAIGALYKLPAPPDPAWEVVDFTITPWKGEAMSTLAGKFDLRYLPFAYNSRLHQRKPGLHSYAGIFVGNTAAEKKEESEERLASLIVENSLLCIGPAFTEKHIDPFLLGQVYASSRCLPNFHYSWEKNGNFLLNERFWQTARCGIPVNDYSPLMGEVFDTKLLESFCFADKRIWRQRVQALNAGTESVDPLLVQELDSALAGHSYHDRMKQLLDWIE